MQRIVKRFLLHKQRENDDIGELDFDELKQDLQMVRYEMNKDLKKSIDETLILIHHISTGLIIIGDEIFSRKDNENSNKFKEYRSTDFEFSDNLSELKNDLITVGSSNSLNTSGNTLTVNKEPFLREKINLDSQGSSTDTGNSDHNTEVVRFSTSLSSETDSSTNLNASSTVVSNDSTQLKAHLSNSIDELQVIREDDELSNETIQRNNSAIKTSSIIIIEHTEQSVKNIYNGDDDERENGKMYII